MVKYYNITDLGRVQQNTISVYPFKVAVMEAINIY